MRAIYVTGAVAVLVLAEPNAGYSQPSPRIDEVRSILQEASALLPQIDAFQRRTTAANIAAEQTRAGDDAGAKLSSVSSSASNPGPFGGVGYSLAVQGRLQEAL